jgi:hypothetical protein
MNQAQQDLFAPLRRSHTRAKFGRAVCGSLFLIPIIAWVTYYALLVVTGHGPDSGFAQTGTILYGLIAAPLLLLPLIGFIAFSIRCSSIARRLPFTEPAHQGTDSNVPGNA